MVVKSCAQYRNMQYNVPVDIFVLYQIRGMLNINVLIQVYLKHIARLFYYHNTEKTHEKTQRELSRTNICFFCRPLSREVRAYSFTTLLKLDANDLLFQTNEQRPSHVQICNTLTISLNQTQPPTSLFQQNIATPYWPLSMDNESKIHVFIVINTFRVTEECVRC